MAIEQPISFVAIDAYGRRFGIEGEAFANLLRFVSVIDSAFLAAREAERNRLLDAAKPQDESLERERPGQNTHHKADT